MFNDFTDYENFEPAGLELPKISLNKELLSKLGLSESASSLDTIKALAKKGIKEKSIDKFSNKKEYYERAKYEIDVLDRLGFVDYILLNWDVIGKAREKGYPIGEGRGSGAGSLINYLLKITNVDPIKFNLYFERFISESRAQKITDKNGKEFLVGSLAPDIDSDISNDHRPLVVDYIEEQYKGKTSKILTFNTFSSKLCIKEACKFFGKLSEEESNKISSLIPKEHGLNVSLKKAMEESEAFRKWAKNNDFIFKNALLVEGLNKNSSVHAAGIAICSQDIKNVIPLQLDKDGKTISGYDMDDVADLMVKFDILGLRTLSIADRACKKIGCKIEDIDPEDDFIYQMLQDFNHPCGLFQISAKTNFEVAKEVKPCNLQELSDVIALARPGALAFVDEYIKQKNFKEPIGLEENLDRILSSSNNVLLYQEQTMKAANEVFAMSLLEAESLRKVIGKKMLDKIPEWKNKIFEAAQKVGVDEKVAKYFWKVVEASGNYSFNLSHSISYSILAAKTVWLKYNHPKEFFTSILEVSEHEQDPMKVVAEVSRELPDFGINLLPPSLEAANMDFSIDGDNIRYGLKSVKGVSEKTKEAIEEFSKLKPENKYEIFETAKMCGINIEALTSLIYAGALGQDRPDRKALEAQAYNLLTKTEKREILRLGEKYNFDLLEQISDFVKNEVKNEKGKPIIKKSRFETFKKKFEPYKQVYLKNRKKSSLAKWWFETNLLGYSPSLKLKDCFSSYGDLTLLKEAKTNLPKKFRSVVRVDNFFVKLNKDNVKYISFEVSDDTEKVNLMFGDWRGNNKCSIFLKNFELKKGDIIVFSGSFNQTGSTVFADTVSIVETGVYLKKTELKK